MTTPAESSSPAERAEAATGAEDAWSRPGEQTAGGDRAEAERTRLLESADSAPVDDEVVDSDDPPASDQAAVGDETADEPTADGEPATEGTTPAGEAAEAERRRLLQGNDDAPEVDDPRIGDESTAAQDPPRDEAVDEPPTDAGDPTATGAAAEGGPAEVDAGGQPGDAEAADDTPAIVPATSARVPTGAGDEEPEGGRLPAPGVLVGLDARGPDGERIGTVEDVYLEREGRVVRYLGIRTVRLGGRNHVIPVDEVRAEERDGDRFLIVPYRREQIDAGPAFAGEEELTPEHEASVYGYYRRIGYWDRERELLQARQTTPAPTPQIAEAEFRDAIALGKDLEGARVTRWSG